MVCYRSIVNWNGEIMRIFYSFNSSFLETSSFFFYEHMFLLLRKYKEMFVE